MAQHFSKFYATVVLLTFLKYSFVLFGYITKGLISIAVLNIVFNGAFQAVIGSLTVFIYYGVLKEIVRWLQCHFRF